MTSLDLANHVKQTLVNLEYFPDVCFEANQNGFIINNEIGFNLQLEVDFIFPEHDKSIFTIKDCDEEDVISKLSILDNKLILKFITNILQNIKEDSEF